MRATPRATVPRALLGSVLVTALLLVPATPAAAFPPQDAGYHTYAETHATITAIAAAHPDIVSIISIGRSFEGRDIWVAKVSDNVRTDEAEPEVLIDAGHHANEHITVEAAIGLLQALTNGYGTDVDATRRVNATELWIAFNLNPDGTEYDQASGAYRNWRKNRQPTPGTGQLGTDINRNYAWEWGCCGGSSGDPSAWNYRGHVAWSTREATALASFVNSRVLGGRQQIRAHITLHSFGRLVLWPWAHTAAGIPDGEDRAVFETLGTQLAQAAAYTAKQSSGLYVTDGDEIDWLYGAHRIFSFTIEMSDRAYPADEAIPGEVPRVLSAAYRLIDVAGCPYAVTGRAAAHCPPAWVSRAAGSDRYQTAAAVSSAFTPGVPVAYVATGSNFPDALGGGVAAGRGRGPLLLVERNRVPASVAAALTRLRPARIVVLGSAGVVSDGVLTALRAFAPSGATSRLAGPDRYATAAAISASTFAPQAPIAFIATGTNFPDALAAVPAAVRAGGPLLLATRDTLPAATVAELRRLRPAKIVVVGGPSVVSDGVLAALRAYAPGGAERIAGTDRYATAAAISQRYGTIGAPVYLATGANFPDALAGGPAAALRGGSLLLVHGGVFPESTGQELKRLRPASMTVLGSVGVLSDETAATAALRAR